MLAGPAGAANIDAQVARLNAAFDGGIQFGKPTVLQYQITDTTDPALAGACVNNVRQSQPCSEPGVTTYLDARDWVQPKWLGNTVPGDPND
jgi:hypothetical protein